MYFVQFFDAKPEVGEERMITIYKELAESWQKAWPDNHFAGLFVRKWKVGAEPSFIAMWDLPDASAMDNWDRTWDQVKGQLEEPDNAFWNAACNVQVKLMDKVAG